MANAAPLPREDQEADIEQAPGSENVSEKRLADLRFEAGNLGEALDEMSAESDKMVKTELQHWVDQGTKFGTRYGTAISPLEQAVMDAAAKEATQAIADFKTGGELNIKQLTEALAQAGKPIQLTKEKIVHPTTESMIVSSTPVDETETHLGDVIPEKPVAKIDVRAEETTPAPDKPKIDYTTMSLAELQKEYERLFDASAADAKANPEKLKPYKAAMKTGIAPNDPEAANSELNKVYAEIQKRRAAKAQPAPVPAAPEAVAKAVEPPPTPPARVVVAEAPAAPVAEVPTAAPVVAEKPVIAEKPATPEDTYKDASAAYFKRFDTARTRVAELLAKGDDASRQKAEGYLTGQILTAENVSADDMLADAYAQKLITKEQLEAISNGGKIETFQEEVVSHLRNMLADVKKGGAVRTPDEVAGIVAPPPAAAEAPKAKKEVVPPREKVVDKLVDFFERQAKTMPRQIKDRIASMQSPEEAAEYVAGLRKTLDTLNDDSVHLEVLQGRIGLGDLELQAMTEEDFEKSRGRFKTLFADAIGVAEAEVAARNARFAQRNAPRAATEKPEPAAPTEAAPAVVEAPKAEAADPTVDKLKADVDVIAETFVAASDAPKTVAMKIGKMLPDAFLTALKMMKRIDDAQEMELKGKTMAVLQLRDAVVAAAKKQAKKK